MFQEMIKIISDLGIITVDDMKRMTAIELQMLIVERINGIITKNKEILEKLDDLGVVITDEVVKKLNEMIEDGTLDKIIGDSVIKVNRKPNIIDVTNYGIKNDGTVIGTELNELITTNVSHKIYFPDGIYNLSEPIELPWRYDKNVDIELSPKAILKASKPLSALIRIGFTEIESTYDKTQRRPNIIEGGCLDCSNVTNGIHVNGLKQLVTIKGMNLIKGTGTHIKVECTNDFAGTGSSDTIIQDIRIQGLSSNEENSCGIYLGAGCGDCKLHHVFIYGCQTGIYTESTGHYMDTVHILSQVTTGGLSLGENDFKNTRGLVTRNITGDMWLNNFYFDTLEVGLEIKVKTPRFFLTNCIYFCYKDNFGDAMIRRDADINGTLAVTMNGCVCHIKKDNFKIFDANIPYIFDPYTRTKVDLTIVNPSKLNVYDAYLSQKVRQSDVDYLIRTDNTSFTNQWIVLGLLAEMPSTAESSHEFIFSNKRSIVIRSSNLLGSPVFELRDPNNSFYFELGKAMLNDDYGRRYQALLFKPAGTATGFPTINHVSGIKNFLRTPSDEKMYRPSDYGITESSIETIYSKS